MINQPSKLLSGLVHAARKLTQVVNASLEQKGGGNGYKLLL
jgi:hypothetical protein